MSDLDATTIKKLAAQLNKIARQPIDPVALGGDLERCAALYFFARHCEDHRAPMSKSRDWLSKALCRTKPLRTALEALTAAEHRYLIFIMADAVERLPDIKEEITERQKAQQPDGLGESEHVTAYDIAVNHLLGVIRDLQKMERWLDVALKHVNEVTGRRRRPPEVCLPILVNGLADIYERHTRRRATTIYYARADKRGSPFVDLVESVVAELEPGKKRYALADTVKNILKERKRAQSEDDPLPLT